MDNHAIAALFDEIADILDIQGANRFRVLAYRKAAASLRDLPEEVRAFCARGELTSIPGVGKELAAKIEEVLQTGRLAYIERLRGEVAPGLLELLRIKGVGPRTVGMLHEKLCVEDLAGLEEAIGAGKLASLPGVREKTIENIRRGIELYREGQKRHLLGAVRPLVEEVREALRVGGPTPGRWTDSGRRGVEEVEVAGSFRRWKETVGDVDFIASAREVGDRLRGGAEVVKSFTSLPVVERVLASGETKGSVLLQGGLQVDLRVVPKASFGAALQYFTGSQAHNVKLRTLAKERGLKVNEYGVFRGERQVAGRDEEGVYAALGLPLIPPELREDRGEVEAAQGGTLPRELLELSHVRGDLHLHSDWSDGRGSLRELALAAKGLGYDYLAIADHSHSSRIARGLDAERLARKLEAVEALAREKPGIHLLKAAEVDIRSDGSLDYPDEVLETLDVVVVAIHSGFGQSRDRMTGRILDALAHPGVHILAHPTGRLIGARDPYEVDLDRVLGRAAERGVAVEANGSYRRLDIGDVACRRAVEMGCLISVNSDAHSVSDLSHMRYAVAQARRGWVERRHVLNCLPWAELKGWLAGRKAGA